MPGIRRSGTTSRGFVVALALCLCIVGAASQRSRVRAEAITTGNWVAAKILGTDGINVRDCPSLSCAVVGSVRLGEHVWVTGPVIDGFRPIDYGGLRGYAYDLYLMLDGNPAPFLIEGNTGCQRIALIFNVGIGDHPILGILDDLAERDVPATVFLMGWWAETHPREAKRIADLGFVIGSHGDQRADLTGLTDEQIALDITTSSAAIEQATGSPPSPWFTAYGAASDDRTRGVVGSAGYLPVEWKVPAADYGPGATAKSVYSRVMPSVYDGAIVEFHLDGPASATSTAVALPWIIDELALDGYAFVTIPEMANPCEASD